MQQILSIDESIMDGNEDIRRIVMRLQSAASDPQVRYYMNIEDQAHAILANRDTEGLLYKNETNRESE